MKPADGIPLILADDRGWETALFYFDNGNRDLLAALVREYLRAPAAVARDVWEPSPEELDTVAAILAGKRKPRRGRRVKPGRELAAQEVQYLREVRDAMKATKPLPRGWTLTKIAFEYDKALTACADRYDTTVEMLLTWAKPTGSNTGL